MGSLFSYARWRTLAAASAALVLVIALLPGGPARGEESPPPGDAGVLLLQLGEGGNAFEYLAPDGTTTTQAVVVSGGCSATLDETGAVLVDVGTVPAAPTGSLGLFAGLGVISPGKAGKGPACARVDAGEALSFSPAGILAGSDFGVAELDIEGRFNATVVAEAYADGELVGTVELETSQSMPAGLSPRDEEHFEWSNYRWLIDVGVPFDELVLSVSPLTPYGSFSVESGGDGTPAGVLGYTESAFTVIPGFEGMVACGESTASVGDGAATPEATFVRGDDGSKNSEPCAELIGYNLDSTVSEADQTVAFEFETAEAPHWFGTFTWTPEPAAIPVPATELDLDSDGVTDGTLVWCSGFSGVDGSTGNPLPILPAGESWCLLSQTSTLVGAGTMQVTQEIYGEADPAFIRPK